MAPPLRSSTEAYRLQNEIAASAVVDTLRYESRGPVKITATIATYQALAAQEGAASVATQLAEQGITAPAVAGVAATAFVGLTSAGAPMEAVVPDVENLARFVATMVQDAGRAGGSLAIAARPRVYGYVRMIGSDNPCSRCIILAGRVYKWSAGFERHPLCRCTHIPVEEDTGKDLVTDPRAIFDSLPTNAELAEKYPDMTREMLREAGINSVEDTFGVAGAQAIRDGADMNQVVNARKDVYLAQSYGQAFLATRAGVTKRGFFGKSNADRPGAGKTKLPYRLMPESIYALADGDRAEALRLLKLYGFLL